MTGLRMHSPTENSVLNGGQLLGLAYLTLNVLPRGATAESYQRKSFPFGRHCFGKFTWNSV